MTLIDWLIDWLIGKVNNDVDPLIDWLDNSYPAIEHFCPIIHTAP